MTRSTRAPKTNRGPTPTGHDQPDDGPTTPTDPDADTLVVVAHHHGHTPDLHPRGANPHYMDDSGHADFGTWEPPDTLPYEYLGDQPNAHPNDHRHHNTAVSNHETGREPHRHAPLGGHRLPVEAADPEVEEDQARDTYDPAETAPSAAPMADSYSVASTNAIEASQARHPSGHDAPNDGLPTDPEERAALADQYRRALAEIDGTAPTPDRAPAIPARANPAAGRLGTDLGGLELVKASFRAMFPGAPDGLDQEWALTMGASDLLGQMLNQHRQPAFADPGLIAGLRTLVEQLDEAAAAREGRP